MAPMARNGAVRIGPMGTNTPHRRAVRELAAVRRLLAALRPGDQPAARRDPRGLVPASAAPSVPRAPARPDACVVPARSSYPGRSSTTTSWPSSPRRTTTVTGPALQAAVVRALPGGRGRRRAAGGARGVRREASGAIEAGARTSSSPTATPREFAPDPVAAAHLGGAPPPVREKTRTQVGLVVEAGDAREVHHMALLIGYGAGAINPYLAFETIEDLIARGPARPDGPTRRSRTTSRPRARACSR